MAIKPPKSGYGFLTVKQTAQRLQRPDLWVYEEIRRRNLASHRLGGRIFIAEKDLHAYVARCRQAAFGEQVTP